VLSDNCKAEIREIIVGYIDSINQRRFVDEPWVREDELISSPFNVRLVPSAIWKSSKYERSFVTGFGNLYEVISRIIGANNWQVAEQQRTTVLSIYQSQRDHISRILDELDHKKPVGHIERREPNWVNELAELDLLRNGEMVDVEVNSDLYLHDASRNTKAYIELKSPKPNKDQTKVSKEKMLKLYCGLHDADEMINLFFSLPFNPWDERINYKHSFPSTYFNMQTSPAVNMGKEYWNFIGNQEGTYEALLALIEEIGNDTRDTILPFLD
jgi:Type II restriction endonuclease, TdeIII